MYLTHLVGVDFRGHEVPIYVFECDITEKDTPKVAGFLFGRYGGIDTPKNRWTTADAKLARKLSQYADEAALTALRAAGVDVEKERKNAVRREKMLLSKEQNELANMTPEQRRKEIQKWLAFAEKDAREKGYVSVNCTNNLHKLGGFHDRQVEARYDTAVELARVVNARLKTPEKLNWIREWLPGGWNNKAAKLVQEAVLLLRQAGETTLANKYEAELNLLRQTYRAANAAPSRGPGELFSLRRGGGRPFLRGGLVRNTSANVAAGQPVWLFVLREGSRYYAQGGREHGVGADRGYAYWAECKRATEREAAEAEDAWRIWKRWDEQVAKGDWQWRTLAAKVCREGEHPRGPILLHTEPVKHPRARAVFSDCFVPEPNGFWYIQANPAEGAVKDLNNVLLGGRPALGHRLPRTHELEAELTCLVALLSSPKPAFRAEVDFNRCE